MKRIISLFMVIIFAFSLVTVTPTAFALIEEFILWESPTSSEQGFTTRGNMGTSTEQAREGKDKSIKVWTRSENREFELTNQFGSNPNFDDRMDLSRYRYINAWIYSPAVYNDAFTIRIFSDVAGSSVNTGRVNVTVDWTGWKCVTVPLADAGSYTIGGTTKTVDWTKVTGYSYNTMSTKDNWNEGDVLYFDKIWLSTEVPGSFPIANEIAFTGTSTENVRLSSETIKIETGTTEEEANIEIPATDITPYSYINMWMYCPSDASYVSGDKTVIPKFRYRFFNSGNTTNRITTLNNYNGYEDSGLANWVGWKLISIPFSGFSNNPDLDKTNLDRFCIITNVNNWNASFWQNTTLYVDKMWLSNEKPASLEIKGIYPKDGYKYISPVDTTISVLFSNEIKKVDESLITIKETSTNTPYTGGMSFETEGDILKIKLDENLSPDTEYTFSITGTNATNDFLDEFGQWVKDNITINFTTAPDLAGASEPIIAVQGDDSVMATAAITNFGATGFAPALYLTACASDGSIIAIEKAAYSSGTELSAILSSGEVQSAVKYNAFVIADENSDIPSLISSSSLPQTGGTNMDLFNIENTFPESLSVTVATGNSGQRDITVFEGNIGIPFEDVLLTVKKEGTLVYIAKATADETGAYTHSAKLSDVGLLDYQASLYGVSKATGTKLNLTDEAADSIRNSINSAASASDVKTIITADTDVLRYGFGLDNDNTENTDVAQLIYDNRPHAQYEDIVTYTGIRRDLYNRIKNLTWSEIDAVICSNGSATADGLLALSNSADYTYYLALGSAERSKVCEYMLTTPPYASIVAFRNKFASAISSYKQSLITSPTPTPTPDDSSTSESSDPGPSYSVGFGGGGGGGTIPSVPSSPAAAFNDLSAHQWAKTAIETLYNRGIISKSSNGNYRPADNITREEFVKLIMSYAKLPQSTTAGMLSDMAEGEWYVSYILSAIENGIINGVSDTEFGIGENIKRCDMAVIIWRLLQKLNPDITYNNNTPGFVDSSSVPDYAVDAVTALSSLGLLNGDNTGRVNPLSTLTRAEAAQVIYNLISFIE